MLLDTAYYDVQNSQESHKFKFSSSPIIFKILSDSLYSNKIGSIIRELASNAKDAHIAAGCPEKPFHIELPVKNKLFDSEAPMFRITDYGVGLSEEDIYNIYTVYGESNKRHSNDMIGGFGIGSKSPFSYTETFTIVSIHNKKKTVYCAYIDEKGFPAISKMSETDTDEHPGVSVCFNVKKDDISDFHEEVVNQLKFFEPKPTLNVSINFNEPKVYIKGDYWFISSDRYYANEHNMRILINGIPYTVESLNIPYNERITKSAIYVNVPIGAIDLNASRESIAYTEKTKTYLKKIFKDVEKDIFNKLLDINKDKSLYERSNFLHRNSIYIHKNYTDFVNTFHVDSKVLDRILDNNGIKLYKYSNNTLRRFQTEFETSYDYSNQRYYRTMHTSYKFYRVSDKIPNIHLKNHAKIDNNSIIIKCKPETNLTELQTLFHGPEIETIDIDYTPIKRTRLYDTYRILEYDRYNYYNSISDMHAYTASSKVISNIADIVRNPNNIILAMIGSELVYHPNITKDDDFYTVMSAVRKLSRNHSKVAGVYIINKSTINQLKTTCSWEFPSYEEWKANIVRLVSDSIKFDDNNIEDICFAAKLTENKTLANFFYVFNRIVTVGTDDDINTVTNECKFADIAVKYKKYSEIPEMPCIKTVYADDIAKIDISEFLGKINSEPLLGFLAESSSRYYSIEECRYLYRALKKYNII